MSEYLDLNSISIVYKGEIIGTVPNTYKAFLEYLRDKVGLSNQEFSKRTIWHGDFPILEKKNFIELLKKNKTENIFQVDLVENAEGDENLFGEKDYTQFLEKSEPDEEIKIKINEEEEQPKIKEEEEINEKNIYIKSDVNEFYAITQVTQYYKNNNKSPVELSIIYPLKKEIIFRKFTLDVNGKKSVSKIFPKEKAEEKYGDAIAGGNIGVISNYYEDEPNSYSINIGNIPPGSTVQLISEFIQFITSDDMSFCFSLMSNYPTFSDSKSSEYSKNINGKIFLKTHSKITRLVNKNFTLDKNYKQEFNPEYTECNIDFKIEYNSRKYNSVLSFLYRTEKMDEPYLLSQYNPSKDETSYIFGKVYESKQIPVPEKPDTNIETNYYLKYEQPEEKGDTPSLFIFLIDQSGSMSGSAIKIVSEAILIFLQSLPKGSYFQLIGFGSSFKKINPKPVEYTKENLKDTINIVENLRADLGGTNISSPLKSIFNGKDYDNIKLARNLFILTDGEVDDREECLELISTNSDKFKVHAIGIGSSFDKQLIQDAGTQGRGSYHFVSNISDVNSIIIESLSKCLRNYILNAKLSLNEIKPEQDFTPKMNFIYPDEILNYYFILKGKEHDNLQINFENNKKTENFLFSKDKIIHEKDGEIIGQIIIGNKLKNEVSMAEEIIIKLSKEYQILSKKTSLFAVGENEENNKIAELKQITQKKREKYSYNNNNNYAFSNSSLANMNNQSNFNNNIYYNSYNFNNNYINHNFQSFNQRCNNNYNFNINRNNPNYSKNSFPFANQINCNNYNNNSNNYCTCLGMSDRHCNNFQNNIDNNSKPNMINFQSNNNYHNMHYANNFNNNNIDYNCGNMNNFDRHSQFSGYPPMCSQLNNNNNFCSYSNSINNNSFNLINNSILNQNIHSYQNYFNRSSFQSNYLNADYPSNNYNKYSLDNEKRLDLENKQDKEEKIVEFSNKELMLTQDIYGGFWNLNPQTKLLIEKEKNIYEKIEQIMQEKNIQKEEVKITLLVLYYLNTDSSVNKVEYMLIIKKGISYLEKNNIKFDEILEVLKK